MAGAIHVVVGQCSWNNQELMKVSRFHTVVEMINLYKSHVLPFIQYRTSGIYPGCDSHLAALGSIQTSFLCNFGIHPIEALMHLNLAPLRARREISMMGLIHRTLLRKGPSHFQRYFFMQKLAARSAHDMSLHETASVMCMNTLVLEIATCK